MADKNSRLKESRRRPLVDGSGTTEAEARIKQFALAAGVAPYEAIEFVKTGEPDAFTNARKVTAFTSSLEAAGISREKLAAGL